MFRSAHFLLFALVLFAPFANAADVRILAVDEPPGSYFVHEGIIDGISVDVVREIQKRIGQKSKIQILPEDVVLERARTQPDVVAMSYTRNKDREQQFRWITQVIRKPWVLYARRPLEVANVEAMRSVGSIGVVRGDVRAKWLESQKFTNTREFPDHKAAIKAMLRGKVDSVFTEPSAVAYTCRDLKCSEKDVVNVYSPKASDVYILMSLATSDAEFDRWVTAAEGMKADGTMQAIASRWAERAQREVGLKCEAVDGVLVFR